MLGTPLSDNGKINVGNALLNNGKIKKLDEDEKKKTLKNDIPVLPWVLFSPCFGFTYFAMAFMYQIHVCLYMLI